MNQVPDAGLREPLVQIINDIYIYTLAFYCIHIVKQCPVMSAADSLPILISDPQKKMTIQ
jgi:hypothetical protein